MHMMMIHPALIHFSHTDMSNLPPDAREFAKEHSVSRHIRFREDPSIQATKCRIPSLPLRWSS